MTGEYHPAPATVADLVTQFAQAMAEPARGLRKNTYAGYARSAKTLTTIIGKVRFADLSRRTVEHFVKVRDEAGRAPRTIETDVEVLHLALRWVGWDKARAGRLTGGIRYGDTTPRSALSRIEIAALRGAIRTPMFRVVFEMALQAGLRLREILTRTWGDWDQDRRTLYVGNVPSIGFRTKNGKARTLPVPSDLGRVLSEEWEHRGRPGPGEWICVTHLGERYAVLGGPEEQMRRLCRDAKTRPHCLHELRHTYGSMLIEAGVDLVTVSRLLGHASVGVTERVYIHIHHHQFALAADRLDAIMSPLQAPATLQEPSAKLRVIR